MTSESLSPVEMTIEEFRRILRASHEPEADCYSQLMGHEWILPEINVKSHESGKEYRISDHVGVFISHASYTNAGFLIAPQSFYEDLPERKWDLLHVKAQEVHAILRKRGISDVIYAEEQGLVTEFWPYSE